MPHSDELMTLAGRVSEESLNVIKADAGMPEFLRTVGRRKFLKPLYSALMAADPERARELYRRNRARYHSVSTGTLDELVGLEG